MLSSRHILSLARALPIQSSSILTRVAYSSLSQTPLHYASDLHSQHDFFTAHRYGNSTSTSNLPKFCYKRRVSPPTIPKPEQTISSSTGTTTRPRRLYTTCPEAADRYLVDFENELEDNFIGFDTEGGSPAATVQLSNGKTILLLQLCKMPYIPYKLITLLSNPNILKVGVNAIGDGFALNMARAGRSAGLVELSSIVSLVYAREEKGNGLRDLTRKLLGLDLRKGIFKKRGEGFVKRWERGLTEKEKTYAANDAHAGFILYQRLMSLASQANVLISPPIIDLNITLTHSEALESLQRESSSFVRSNPDALVLCPSDLRLWMMVRKGKSLEEICHLLGKVTNNPFIGTMTKPYGQQATQYNLAKIITTRRHLRYDPQRMLELLTCRDRRPLSYEVLLARLRFEVSLQHQRILASSGHNTSMDRALFANQNSNSHRQDPF